MSKTAYLAPSAQSTVCKVLLVLCVCVCVWGVELVAWSKVNTKEKQIHTTSQQLKEKKVTIKTNWSLCVFCSLLLTVLFPLAQCRSLFWSFKDTWCEWVSLLTYFLSSSSNCFTLVFSSSSFLSSCRQRTLWTWLAFLRFDWLQDTFCKCHSGYVRCVNLWNRKKMKRMCLRFLLPPAFLAPITAIFICFFSLQFVVTGKKVGSKRLSLSDFPAYFPLFFTDTVAIHIPCLVTCHCSFWEWKPTAPRRPHSDRPVSEDIVFLWAYCWALLLLAALYSTFIPIMQLKDCIIIMPNILHIVIKAHNDC